MALFGEKRWAYCTLEKGSVSAIRISGNFSKSHGEKTEKNSIKKLERNGRDEGKGENLKIGCVFLSGWTIVRVLRKSWLYNPRAGLDFL
jgi:hypothetical protein